MTTNHEAWDTGESWLMSAHRAWERLGELRRQILDPRKAQRSMKMLRSDLEEAKDKSEGKAKQVLTKALATLTGLIVDLNRVHWSMSGERFREETLLTLEIIRDQIESTLPALTRSASGMAPLRDRMILLAYERPELRSHLLPLLRLATARYLDLEQDIEDDYKRRAITHGEKDELLRAIRNSASRREAEKVVEDSRRMRTSSFNPSKYFSKYRVNFGQGQATKDFRTLKEAERELARQMSYQSGSFFIQGWDPETGDWINRDQRGNWTVALY